MQQTILGQMEVRIFPVQSLKAVVDFPKILVISFYCTQIKFCIIFLKIKGVSFLSLPTFAISFNFKTSVFCCNELMLIIPVNTFTVKAKET